MSEPLDNRSEDEQARIDEVLAKLDIKTGVGDPASPFFGQTLSAEDEAKHDPSGQPIVDGKRWGDCSTGLYITVAVSGSKDTKCDLRILGGSAFPVSLTLSPLGLNMLCLTTQGKPAFNQSVAGASLELPSDLGTDALKRKYLVEWIRDTAAEALALQGVDLSSNKAKYQELGLAMAMSAQKAIEATGL